jgi:glycosyltransferase involved in cell wall biosynthesis
MAMAFARPVIASEVGELGELVRETGMGLLVPPGDATALAAAINWLLETPALRRECAVAAIAAAAGVMSPAVVAAATLEVYAHAIAGHSQG